MDLVERAFKNSLNRESVSITIGENTHDVLFRRNDKGETTPYNTLYALCHNDIKQGKEFTLNNNQWLIIKATQDENLIYQKCSCLKCNATIKMQYGKDDLVVYNVFMADLQDKLNVEQHGIITDSKAELIMSLTDDSKRFDINKRFYCGAYIQPFVITDINYLDGLCYVYAERTSALECDDKENGIANRWDYEEKEPPTPPIPIGDIEITPDDDGVCELCSVTYTCSIIGVENPVWQIELNPNGNTKEYYNSIIDNDSGTFTVECLNMSKFLLIYTITEQTTGKTLTKKVRLKGIF